MGYDKRIDEWDKIKHRTDHFLTYNKVEKKHIEAYKKETQACDTHTRVNINKDNISDASIIRAKKKTQVQENQKFLSEPFVKFRGIAKNDDDKSWVYGYYYRQLYSMDDNGAPIYRHYIVMDCENKMTAWMKGLAKEPLRSPIFVEVIGETVTQWSKCTDLEGNDIYEGDIVEVYEFEYVGEGENHRPVKKKVFDGVAAVGEMGRGEKNGASSLFVGCVNDAARLAAKNFREAVYGYKIVGNFFEDPEWYNEIKRGKYKDDLNSNDDDGFDDIWDRIDPESDGDDEA